MRGNRKLNDAMHLIAVTQIRNTGTPGRVFYDCKLAEGKTKKEALRALKRRVSHAVWRQLQVDLGRGHRLGPLGGILSEDDGGRGGRGHGDLLR